MSDERGEILDDFTDGSVFGFDNSVKVRGHEYKSVEQRAFLFSEPFERTKHNASVVLIREKWPPTADCCGDEVKMSGVVKGIKCHGITAARTPPLATTYSSYLNVPEASLNAPAAVLGSVKSHAFVTVTNTIGLRLVSL